MSLSCWSKLMVIYIQQNQEVGLQLSEKIITMNSQNINTDHHSYRDDHEADDHQLPGFRFHPTDEELVGFYLRRKVEKKPLSIELIKQIDIYKHDPWDLPKISSTPENEGFFFCKRGRKYRNSVRPNRVTGSGFWKATGIDKPVYPGGGEGHECIGLKKTLVYYRGAAGKGTKTDWMMNEFRLPSNDHSSKNNVANAKTTSPEAEVWTICRIFKRNVSSRKLTNWRDQSSAKRQSCQSSVTELPSATLSYSTESNNQEEAYISFENHHGIHHHTDYLNPAAVHQINGGSQFSCVEQLSSNVAGNPYESMASSSSHPDVYENDCHELFTQENWDEIRSAVEFALECPSFSF